MLPNLKFLLLRAIEGIGISNATVCGVLGKVFNGVLDNPTPSAFYEFSFIGDMLGSEEPVIISISY